MDIQSLYQDILARVKNKTLVLANEPGLTAEIIRVADNTPQRRLVIQDCSLSLKSDATAPTITVAGAVAESWPIPGVSDSDIRTEAVKLTIVGGAGESPQVDTVVSGAVTIGRTTVPVEVRISDDNMWQLTALPGGEAKFALGDLMTWVGGTAAQGALPEHQAGLLISLPAAVDQLSAEIGYGDVPQSNLRCSIGVSAKMPLLEKLLPLSLQTIEIAAIHFRSGSNGFDSSLSLGLKGQLDLGGRLYGIEVINLGGPGRTVAKFAPAAAHDLPALKDLAALAGGGPLSQTFQQTGRRLGLDGISLTGSEINFESATGKPVSVAMFGGAKIAGVPVDVFFRMPEFFLSCQSAGSPLQLADLIQYFLPRASGLPEARLIDLSVSASIRDKHLSLYGRIEGTIPIDIGPRRLAVEKVALDVEHSAEDSETATRAMLAGLLEFDGLEVSILGEIDDGTLTLTGSIPHINLTKIIGQIFNDTLLPEGLPDFEFEDIALSITPSTGGFSLGGSTAGEWRFPENGQGLSISEASVLIEREKADDSIHCSIEIDVRGPGQVAEGLSLDAGKLTFVFNGGRTWGCSGSLTAHLFDKNLALKADYQKSENGFSLTCKWSRQPPLSLLAIPNAVSLNLSDFSVTLTRDTRSGFGVGGTGSLTIGTSLFEADFQFELITENNRSRLALVVQDPSPITVTFGPVAGFKPHCELAFSKIDVRLDGEGQKWSLGAAASGTLKDIPAIVQEFFPKDLTHGRLGISDEGISFDYPLKQPLTLGSKTFSLTVDGQEVLPEIRVARIGVLLGKNPALVSCLQINLPEALNYFLGTDPETKKPRYVFLNPDFDLELAIGQTLSLALANGTTPFRDFNFRDDSDGQGPYFVVNFGGGFNAFRISVPVFEYSGDGWTAGAGLTVLDPPIRIPLVPLKFVLRQLHVSDFIVNHIPDSVPIDIIDFKRHTDFRSVLSSILSESAIQSLYDPDSDIGQVLGGFDLVWSKIAQGIELLPTDFKPYTTPPDVRQLKLKLGVSPVTAGGGGGWSGGIETDGRHPISFMLPMLGTLPPELVGFSLNALEFGWASSGAYATFKIDGRIDRFDLVTLALAVAAISSKPGSALLSRQEVADLANHLTLKHVSGIFFPGFPVPIPLLYEKIKWRYKNWWGLGGHARVEFDTDTDITIWRVLTALAPFIMDSEFKYKLHDHPEAGPHLTLQIGPNNLQLPGYLGGYMLGSTADGPKLPVDYSIRYLLDAFKFTNPGYAIQAIPLKDPRNDGWIRLGFKTVRFGPLEFEAGWCITTEEEFTTEIAGDNDAEAVLGRLDPRETLDRLLTSRKKAVSEKGFIVLLTAGFGVGSPQLNLLSYRTQFSMAFTSSRGFETGIYLAGSIGPLSLTVAGGIQYSRQGNLTINGSSDLRFGDTPLIHSETDVIVTDRSFEIGADLKFGDKCRVGGTFYLGADKFFIEGHLVWDYAANRRIAPQDRLSAQIDENGLLVELPSQILFGSTCDIGLYVNADGIGARASMSDLTALNSRFGASLEDYQGQIDRSVQAAAELAGKAESHLKSFDDIRKTLPGFLATLRTKTIPNLINSNVRSAYTKLSGIQKKVVNESKIKRDAIRHFNKYYAPKIQQLESQLKAIKGPDEAAKNDATRNLLIGALNDVLGIKSVTYTYTFTVNLRFWSKDYRKTVTINDPIRSSRKTLEQLKSLIGRLPDDWDCKSEFDVKTLIKKQIDGVMQDIKTRIPTIISVELDIPLRFKNPAVDATIQVQYGGQSHQLEAICLDLVHPEKSITSIAKSFTDALASL